MDSSPSSLPKRSKANLLGKLENFSCRHAALIASEGLNRKLAPWEKVSLWVHRSTCVATKNYQRQLRLIEELRQELFNDPTIGAKLPEDFRQQIEQKLAHSLPSKTEQSSRR